jgi:hypothetical protein
MDELAPHDFIEYYRLNWKNLTRQRQRFTKEEEKLAISVALFHPGVTFTGVQPFILLAAANGTIMKFNSNRDVLTGDNYRRSVLRVVNSKILTPTNAEYPKDFGHVWPVSKLLIFSRISMISSVSAGGLQRTILALPSKK